MKDRSSLDEVRMKISGRNMHFRPLELTIIEENQVLPLFVFKFLKTAMNRLSLKPLCDWSLLLRKCSMLELTCCPRRGTFSRIPFDYTFNDQKGQRTHQAYSLLARFGVDHKKFRINLCRDLHLHWNNADCNKQCNKPNHDASDSAIRKHMMFHCSRNDSHRGRFGGGGRGGTQGLDYGNLSLSSQ